MMQQGLQGHWELLGGAGGLRKCPTAHHHEVAGPLRLHSAVVRHVALVVFQHPLSPRLRVLQVVLRRLDQGRTVTLH